MDPRHGDDLLCSQAGAHPVPRLGRRDGGVGHGHCPVEVGGGDTQDPLRVPAGHDDEEEQGGSRALLPEDLLWWWALLVLGRGGGRRGRTQPRGTCVADGRVGHQVGSLGNASHLTAYGEVSLMPWYTGLVGRGRVGVRPASFTNIVTSPTSKSLSG